MSLTEPTWQQLCEFVKQLKLPLLLQGQKHLKQSEFQIKNTTQPRLWLEVTLLGLLPQRLAPVTQAPVAQPPAAPITPVPQTATPAPAPQPASTSPPILAQLLARINDSHAFANGTADGIQALVAALAQTAQQNSTLFDQVVGAIQGLRNGSAPTSPSAPAVQSPASKPVPQYAAPSPPPQQQSAPPKVASPPEKAPEKTPKKVPAPTPAAPAPLPAVQSAIPESQPNVNLEQLWLDILKTLQPPSTQMLLRQMGKLLAFDGRKAYIGATQTWHAKINDKRDAVAKAFSDHFSRPIAIEITVGVPPAASQPTGIAPSSSPPVPAPAPPPPPTPPPPDPSVDFAPDPQPPPKLETTSDEVAAPDVVPPPTASSAAASTNGKSRAIADDRPPAIQSPKDWKPDDEVTRSAKQLAEFFNGEIVYLDQTEDEEKDAAKK